MVFPKITLLSVGISLLISGNVFSKSTPPTVSFDFNIDRTRILLSDQSAIYQCKLGTVVIANSDGEPIRCMEMVGNILKDEFQPKHAQDAVYSAAISAAGSISESADAAVKAEVRDSYRLGHTFAHRFVLAQHKLPLGSKDPSNGSGMLYREDTYLKLALSRVEEDGIKRSVQELFSDQKGDVKSNYEIVLRTKLPEDEQILGVVSSVYFGTVFGVEVSNPLYGMPEHSMISLTGSPVRFSSWHPNAKSWAPLYEILKSKNSLEFIDNVLKASQSFPHVIPTFVEVTLFQ